METVKEISTWFQTFVRLYERAAPVIRQIANPDRLAGGELPVSPYTLVESSITLRPILEASRKALEPKEQEFGDIRREFEIALSSSIKAAEAAAKYIGLRERGVEAQAVLSTIINSTVLANEYFESVSRKLERFRPLMDELEAEPQDEMKPELLPIEEYLQEMGSPDDSKGAHDKFEDVPSGGTIPSPAGVQPVIDKMANGIERGLDKLGDAIIFPFDQIAKATTRISRSSKGKKDKQH